MSHCAAWLRTGLLALGLSFSSAVFGHAGSDAYGELELSATAVKLQIAVQLADLDEAFEALDANADRSITWGELQAAGPLIRTRLWQEVRLVCDESPLQAQWALLSLERRDSGVFARYSAIWECPDFAVRQLQYQWFSSIETAHRLLLQVSGASGTQAMVIASSPNPKAVLLPSLSAARSGLNGWTSTKRFFVEGVYHFLTGADHIAFLLCLLLPIGVGIGVGIGRDQARARRDFARLALTVTAFTLGHSLTLALASLAWITVPAWTEVLIAFSVGLGAVLNLLKVQARAASVLALTFGLIHGLGLSGVLQDARFDSQTLIWALLGFNLGVEFAQLGVVLVWWVLSARLRQMPWYDSRLVPAGSALLLLASGVWVLERL